jgi:phosphotransferase system IIA component
MFPQISNPNYQNSSTETKIHISWNKKNINHFKVSYRNKTKVLCPTKGNSISNLDFQKVKQRKETKTPPSFTKSKANTKTNPLILQSQSTNSKPLISSTFDSSKDLRTPPSLSSPKIKTLYYYVK